MSGFFKKLMATGAVLSMGLTSVAFANNAYNNACCPPPVCDPCCGNWCDNFSFDASWLYWKVSGDEFDYAVEKRRVIDDTPPDTFDENKIHDLKFDWDSGFRVGVGFDSPCMGWGFKIDWTHFDTSNSKRRFITGTTGGTPGVTTFVGFPVVDDSFATLATGQSAEFRAHQRFRYNIVDVEMGKWLCCGCSYVMFRPHVGLRFADIHDSLKDTVIYNTDDETFVVVPSGASEERFHYRNRFKGVGIRAGLDTDLRICDGWSIIGRAAASLIWGTTHIKQDFGYDVVTNPNFYDSDVKESYRHTRVITDLSLGVRYRTLACDCYPITLEFAWEQHYLFGQRRFWVDDSYLGNINGVNAISTWKKHGDVALQGFTLTAGVDF